jgi:hypothetical protein
VNSFRYLKKTSNIYLPSPLRRNFYPYCNDNDEEINLFLLQMFLRLSILLELEAWLLIADVITDRTFRLVNDFSLTGSVSV